MPPAGDVRAGVEGVAHRCPQRQHGRGVDHRRAEQLVGHAVVRARPDRIPQLEAGPLQQDVAGQRVAVRAQSGRGQAHHRVTGAHALGPELGPLLHGADGEAGQVELVARHDPGVLGRLAPDQRAAGLATALVYPGHNGRHLIGVDLAGGDVVEHEQRLGPHADEVVDAHGHQVDADRVVAAGVAGHDHFRADAIGRGHENGVREAAEVERELATEPADALHQAVQALHGGIAGRNIHPGAGVGGAALSHDGQTPGRAPWWALTATGSGRRRLTDTGTGVG